MSSEEEKHNHGKGFGALSAMVSDIDEGILNTADQKDRESPSSSTQTDCQEQAKPTQQTYQSREQLQGGSSGSRWLFGSILVIGLIWLISQQDSTTAVVANSPAPFTTSGTFNPAPQPSTVQPQININPTEERPPIGRGNILSMAQIRYCLAEDIRIEGTKSVVNNYVEFHVDKFNALVTDYNSRCSYYRYREGFLERAQREIEPHRNELYTEGRLRLVPDNEGSIISPEIPRYIPNPPLSDSRQGGLQTGLNETVTNNNMEDNQLLYSPALGRMVNPACPYEDMSGTIRNQIGFECAQPNPLIPASFDCSKSRTSLEILICGDDQLSNLDGQVGRSYTELRKILSRNTYAESALLEEQRDFLQERLRRCPIPITAEISEDKASEIINCLKVTYIERLHILNKRL